MKTQVAAVVEAMERNGGYSTLGRLYIEALKVGDVKWKTKTPFASIRRIVQTSDPFFKVKPGLWALKDWRDRLPGDVAALIGTSLGRSGAELPAVHSYYQGLAAEVGTLRGFQSYVPAQDGGKSCAGRKLKEVASTTKMPPFTYERVLRSARMIDVVWFNTRGFPDTAVEVENSTDFRGAFEKFTELLDFRTTLMVVGPAARHGEFDRTIEKTAYEPVRQRVRFVDYETLADLHSKTAAAYRAERSAGLLG